MTPEEVTQILIANRLLGKEITMREFGRRKLLEALWQHYQATNQVNIERGKVRIQKFEHKERQYIEMEGYVSPKIGLGIVKLNSRYVLYHLRSGQSIPMAPSTLSQARIYLALIAPIDDWKQPVEYYGGRIKTYNKIIEIKENFNFEK